ncbi:hypothetical protein GCM10011282_08490 [Undibacterium macrobrachii]|uniref:Uncharacterized protein n=1 Tax=Undibacterium macrobrachii TaxID=1119058 RepID=A0ABQ2X8X4_9BURK|nr:hypothetical protein GCM10011282_08490 [Undibacterium macrobrachii]
MSSAIAVPTFGQALITRQTEIKIKGQNKKAAEAAFLFIFLMKNYFLAFLPAAVAGK